MKPLSFKLLALLFFTIIVSQQIVVAQDFNQSLSDEISTLEWTRTYPAVTKGITSVYIKVRLNKQSVVYYAFYKNDVEGINAQTIKNDATSATAQNKNIVKWGSIGYAGASSTGSILVEGLEKGKTYYLYLVADNEDEFMDFSEIKCFKITLTLKHKIIPIGTTASPYGYLEYLPKGYNALKDSLFPLIIFLHGAGAVGDGSYTSLTIDAGLLREGIIRYLELDFDLPAVILSPQASVGWIAKTIDGFVEYAKLNYKIDPNRIYVTGISMGGGGTWSYLSEYHEKVAAAMPLCGINSSIIPQNLVNTPIWAFHNDKDPTIPLSTSINKIKSIIKAGGNPFLSVFESDDHSCAYDAYHYPGVWEWLFAQKKTIGVQEAGITNAYRTYLAQNIDGDLTDSSWMVQSNKLKKKESSNGLDSSNFRLLWDADKLYVGVNLFSSKNVENNLNDYEVSVYINGNNNRDSVYDAFDKAITFNYTNNTIEGIGNIDNIDYAWTKNNNTLSLEIAIPFKNSFCINPFAGNGFGFDISISNTSNNDLFFWNGNAEDTAKTNHYGNILLSLKTPENEKQTSILNRNTGVNNSLLSCFPNPFSNNTTIAYKIQDAYGCTIKLTDCLGNEITTLENKLCNPGSYSIDFNGSLLKPGIYYIYLSNNKGIYDQKLVKQ